jgi:hypothetical protein
MPDAALPSCVDRLRERLSMVRPVASLRSAPEFQRSAKRRLVFVQFAGVPLFWRVDIEVFAKSIGQDRAYDHDNRAVRGDDWSLTHSALMNAIAAVKALLRGREDEASGLLARGFARIDHPVPQGALPRQVIGLARAAARVDPDRAELAESVIDLCADAFGETGGR